jgi:ABC-type nitrate/sulfonate/bicarbonate transport system substrate-binding protein
MKKLLKFTTCALLAGTLAVGFTGCSEKTESGKVTLVALSDATTVGVDDCDYWVIPEPAASTKVNAIESLNFAGDLQELYGSESGYPQAVIVAKTELLSYSFMGKFTEELTKNVNWLMDENISSATIISAITSHLTEGLQATFNAKNLTKSVIENCGINFTTATNSKSEIVDFMSKINDVSDTSFGTPSDSFFYDGNYPETAYSGNVSVYVPDGAPALSIAKMLADDVDFGDGVNVNYNVVSASTIQTYVTGANPTADVCILPVNLAVKLLGSGNTYKLLGTVTHGNLYLVSNSGEKISTSNLSTLKGKRVGVVNLSAVPGLTFKMILKSNNIEYELES